MSRSDQTLEVENLDLIFNMDMYRPWTLRDVFVNAVQNPAKMFRPTDNRLHILKSVSFSAHRGERIGIIGVNGTGKTSLCRCIAGLYVPTSGAIRAHGSVRAIFDTAVGIFPELTGRENAELLAELMFPEIPEQHEDIVSEALEFSELGKFIDVPFRLYSNGMQARLCLSMISSRPCDLLILDEVFEGADSFFREKIARRVLKMIEASGTVLFVSHSPDQLRTVCNRVIVLDRGKVTYDGNVANGLQYYESLKPS